MVKVAVAGDHFMQVSRRNRVIVLEDLDFVWERNELNQIAKMWSEGKYLRDIAFETDRKDDEVFLALFHLSRAGKITSRKGGLF